MQEYMCDNLLECMNDARFQKMLQVARLDAQENVRTQNICRIHAHSRTTDWLQPPNRSGGKSGTGTGFLLNTFPIEDDCVYILTAHHVVASSVQVRVNFAKVHSEYTDAIVIGANADMDVAVLMVQDLDFATKMRNFSATGLVEGNSDEIRTPATVTAHGFALGSTHMQSTKGVIGSRIDSPGRLQTDVAVNPGNSGGPVLDEHGNVVGIVQSGMVNAQGINYLVPITEFAIIAHRIVSHWKQNGKFVPDKLPSFNASFTKCNRAIVQRIPECESGIFCTTVHPLIEYPQSVRDALHNIAQNKEKPIFRKVRKSVSKEDLHRATSFIKTLSEFTNVMTRHSWYILLRDLMSQEALYGTLGLLRNDTLQEGDIVHTLTVKGQLYNIDLQMTCNFDFWMDRIGFGAILDRLECHNDSVEFSLFRGLDSHKVSVELQPQLNTFRKMHIDIEPLKYGVLAGVFIMPMIHNHVSIFTNNALHTLMTRPENRHDSFLMVTHILPESPYNESETITAADILVSVNNIPVTTLTELESVWKSSIESGNEIVTLRMRDGSLTTATVQDIHAAGKKIKLEYRSEEYDGFHAMSNDV